MGFPHGQGGVHPGDADDGQQAGQHGDEHDRHAGDDQHLPGHVEDQLGVAARHLAEGGGQADAQAVADRADDRGLQQDHAPSRALLAPIALSIAKWGRFSTTNV